MDNSIEENQEENVCNGKVYLSPEVKEEIKLLISEFSQINKKFEAISRTMSYLCVQPKKHMYWELHIGCIPCAFVCDCCSNMFHRCSTGEDMWGKVIMNMIEYYAPTVKITKNIILRFDDFVWS